MKIDLSGKVALVTGGARGIGGACSLALARLGATVIINYCRSKDAAERLQEDIAGAGGQARTFQADVSKPDEVEAMFAFLRREYARLDILVNNAGIIRDTLLLLMTLDDWQSVQDVNVTGTFLCTRCAVEMMLRQHGGKIITIASASAVSGGRGQTNYAASKGALVSFTRASAVELGRKGIQINAVLPGIIETDMSKAIRERAGEALLERIPVRRFGQPSEVASLVAFLASEESNYIIGQAISIDGGLSIS
ncbi:MAG: fabG [candidate division NC10 bacterium]|nr:fabG [candidate division NC10 bacterium]